MEDNGTTTSLEQELETSMMEIFGTESEAMPVEVLLRGAGHVVLDCRSVAFTLDTGQPIEFEEIARMAEEYWNEGNSNHGKHGE